MCEGRLDTGCFVTGLEVYLPVGALRHYMSETWCAGSGLIRDQTARVATSSVKGDLNLDNSSCTGGKVQ